MYGVWKAEVQVHQMVESFLDMGEVMPTKPGNADFDELYDDPGRLGLQTRLRIWKKGEDGHDQLRFLVGSNSISHNVGFCMTWDEVEELADWLDDWLEQME